MNIQDLSEREILALQYSLLEEMKHKPKETVVTATFNKELTISAEEFIKQRFKNANGNYENNDHYYCRLKWFELGCPKYKHFVNNVNYSYDTLKEISAKYGWQDIKKEAFARGYVPNKSKFVDKSRKTVKRDSKEYNRFRESVLKRDGVCQCCGSNEDLEVHHLFSFKKYNSLGADTKNGITLCKECHTQYHSKYGTKKNNNPVTFSQFLRDYGMGTQTSLDESSPNPFEESCKEFEDLVSYILGSTVRFKVLSTLGLDTRLTPTALSNECEITPAQVSTTLYQLKEKGLAECLNEDSTKGRLFKRTMNGEIVFNQVKEIKEVMV